MVIGFHPPPPPHFCQTGGGEGRGRHAARFSAVPSVTCVSAAPPSLVAISSQTGFVSQGWWWRQCGSDASNFIKFIVISMQSHLQLELTKLYSHTFVPPVYFL